MELGSDADLQSGVIQALVLPEASGTTTSCGVSAKITP
jgi:hypothetical protein